MYGLFHVSRVMRFAKICFGNLALPTGCEKEAVTLVEAPSDKPLFL